MKGYFGDITKRIKVKPTWYDSNGTPRYGKFKPEMCPNIYADEVCLIEIACQACRRIFKVEMHSYEIMNKFELSKFVKSKSLHYGDPPSHADKTCASGDSMNCLDYRVLEFWRRARAISTKLFERVKKLEVNLGDIEEKWLA